MIKQSKARGWWAGLKINKNEEITSKNTTFTGDTFQIQRCKSLDTLSTFIAFLQPILFSESNA